MTGVQTCALPISRRDRGVMMYIHIYIHYLHTHTHTSPHTHPYQKCGVPTCSSAGGLPYGGRGPSSLGGGGGRGRRGGAPGWSVSCGRELLAEGVVSLWQLRRRLVHGAGRPIGHRLAVGRRGRGQGGRASPGGRRAAVVAGRMGWSPGRRRRPPLSWGGGEGLLPVIGGGGGGRLLGGGRGGVATADDGGWGRGG